MRRSAPCGSTTMRRGRALPSPSYKPSAGHGILAVRPLGDPSVLPQERLHPPPEQPQLDQAHRPRFTLRHPFAIPKARAGEAPRLPTVPKLRHVRPGDAGNRAAQKLHVRCSEV